MMMICGGVEETKNNLSDEQGTSSSSTTSFLNRNSEELRSSAIMNHDYNDIEDSSSSENPPFHNNINHVYQLENGMRDDENNTAPPRSSMSYSDSSCQSSEINLMDGTLETIPVSSLVPEDSLILDRISFELPSRDEGTGGGGEEEDESHSNTHSDGLSAARALANVRKMVASSSMQITENPQQGEMIVEEQEIATQQEKQEAEAAATTATTTRTPFEPMSIATEDPWNPATDDAGSDPLINSEDEPMINIDPTITTVTAKVPEMETSSRERIQQNQRQDPNQRPDFEMGDHVYQWCSFAGIPRVFQHHGIILDVYWCEIEHQWTLKIVDFSNWDLQTDSTEHHTDAVKRRIKKKSFTKSNCPNGGCIRTYDTAVGDNNENDDPDRWYKVEYRANWWKRHTYRSGTCTAADCDAPGLVRSRVQFLLDHSDMLPPYSAVHSNCECVAVWCKTGTWATLQATSWLYLTAAGQAKSAATLAGVAASTSVTVPAAGMWGWFGYTTTTSLAATQPFLIPAIAAYGVVTAAGPALWLLHAKKHWKRLTEELNTAFWENAVDHPDVFVECITHWSDTT